MLLDYKSKASGRLNFGIPYIYTVHCVIRDTLYGTHIIYLEAEDCFFGCVVPMVSGYVAAEAF